MDEWMDGWSQVTSSALILNSLSVRFFKLNFLFIDYFCSYLFYCGDRQGGSWVVDLAVVKGRSCFRGSTTELVSSCFGCRSVILVCRRRCRFLQTPAASATAPFGPPDFLTPCLWTKPEKNCFLLNEFCYANNAENKTLSGIKIINK